MSINTAQPMRQAEIDLIDDYNQNMGIISDIQGDISDVETTIGTLQTNIEGIQTDVDNAETAIGTLQTDVDNVETAIGTLQTDVDNAESAIGTLQTNVTNLQNALSNLTTLQTINYINNISPATDVVISEATLRKIGRIAMLHVDFSYSGSLAANTQKRMFDILGDYAPIAGCPASINGATFTAMVSKDKALWIKTYGITFTGTHYIDCIYISAN